MKNIAIICDCDNTLMPDLPSLLLKDNEIEPQDFWDDIDLLVRDGWDINCSAYNNQQDLCNEKNHCVYHNPNCISDESYLPFEITQETKWNHVVEEHKMFLEKKSPVILSYNGPFANETNFIIDYLIEITNNGIITQDSEPGLFLVNWTIPGSKPETILPPYIQNPYLYLVGPNHKINNLKKKLSGSKYIRLDPYDGYGIEQFDKPEYLSIVLGVDDSKLDQEFFNYIFTDGFFKEIVIASR